MILTEAQQAPNFQYCILQILRRSDTRHLNFFLNYLPLQLNFIHHKLTSSIQAECRNLQNGSRMLTSIKMDMDVDTTQSSTGTTEPYIILYEQKV